MCDYHCISLVFISPDDRFGRLRCLLSPISTFNSPADRTQTQCTLPNRCCTLISILYVHCVQYMLPSTAECNRLYIRHTLQTIQHVQLLYMVHCHCEGQMNGCAKIQPVTTHLLLSQLPLPSIGSPTARIEQAVHHHHRLGWNVGDGCVDKGSRHPAHGVGPAPNFGSPNVRQRHCCTVTDG